MAISCGSLYPTKPPSEYREDLVNYLSLYVFKRITEFERYGSAGIALGEAVQKGRTVCKEPGDSSWPAYELYGQPNSHIKLGTT